jgi:hypothetical protein
MVWRRVLVGLPVVAVVVAGCSSGVGSLPVGPRPVDACSMLTSDQVADIVGTPGPFTGAHEDAADDGSPVWGCTWGTENSYADLRELTAAQFRDVSTPDSGTVRVPLSGIGDKAMLTKNKSDGGNSYVYLATAGRYYAVQVTVDRRSYQDAGNADREAGAGQTLAKVVVPGLSG